MKFVQCSLICLALSLVVIPATAQPFCGPREKIAEQLNKKFGEKEVFFGISKDGKEVLEVFANQKTGTWTSIVSNSEGKSCLTGTGDGYEIQIPKKPGQDS